LSAVREWYLGSVVGGPTGAQLVSKKRRPDEKIDAVVALMMAIGRALVEDESQAGLNGFLANPIAF
jgi:phage terminase large subunit-like protein